MNIRLIISSLVLVPLLATGCSSSSEVSDSGSDSAEGTFTADQVLDGYLSAYESLQSVTDSKESLLSGLNGFIDGLNPLVAPLTDGIAGVPEQVTFDLAVALGATTVTMGLVVDCMEDAASPSECSSLLDSGVTQSGNFGETITELVPFSS